jgi:hypothetical protein
VSFCTVTIPLLEAQDKPRFGVSRQKLASGQVHFLRLINSQGQIKILNELWMVKEKLLGEYVWATISTAEQQLRIYHQESADAAQQLVAEHDYEIAEEVQSLAPEYRVDGGDDTLA